MRNVLNTWKKMENKYKSLSEFKKDFPSECDSLRHKKLLIKLCEDMNWDIPKSKKKTKPNGYWNDKQNCLEEALKYQKITEWQNSNSASIKSARINGWFEECTVHMIKQNITPRSYWTKERCMEQALKYETKSKWAKNSDASYKIAKKNNWFEECTAHMIELQKPGGYWTKEKCLEEALKYNTRTEWKEKNRASYQAAMVSKILNECTAHMIELQKPSGHWNNKEHCMEEALKHNGRFEWQKKSSASYNSARNNGWLDECCAHMKVFFKKS